MSGWYGVDFDGTLVKYEGWKGAEHIGTPIPKMVERVKMWLAQGRDVRIFTARCWPIGVAVDLKVEGERYLAACDAVKHINEWCLEHLGRVLPVTCIKDYHMIVLYDDRCRQVEANTGRIIEDV